MMEVMHVAVDEKCQSCISHHALLVMGCRFTSEISIHLFSHLHHAEDFQALIAFNIGLHEPNRKFYFNHLSSVFSHANSSLLTLGKNPSRNKFLYRETSAQHFHFPAGNYDYHVMKNWKANNGWKKYDCLPSVSTDSEKHNWRYQVEKQLVEGSGDHVHFVPFRAITRHYYDMHAEAFVQTEKKRSAGTDCTHFDTPGGAVIAHRILWQSLLVH
jgi:hypothetical protein